MTRKPTIRFSLKFLLVLVLIAACAVFFGKLRHDRNVRRAAVEEWIDLCVADYSVIRSYGGVISSENTVGPAMAQLSEKEQLVGLTEFAIEAKDPFQQVFALRLITKLYPDDRMPALRAVCSRSTNDKVKLAATACLAATRSEDNRSVFNKLLNEDNPDLRQAAIDGLGLLQSPSRNMSGLIINSEPFIGVGSFRHPSLRPDRKGMTYSDGVKTWVGGTRKLEELPLWQDQPEHLKQMLHLMHTSQTQPERDSAARAIGGVGPSDYQLRLAEWGVWINSKGSMELSKRIIEEIPEFVHRSTTERRVLESFRVNVPITKPIIHFTANTPLALKLEVGLQMGQPYFFYPRPDKSTVDSFGSPPLAFEKYEIEPNVDLPFRRELRWGGFGQPEHFVTPEVEFSWLFFPHKPYPLLGSKDTRDFYIKGHAKDRKKHADPKKYYQAPLVRSPLFETRHNGGYATCSLNYDGLIVTPNKPDWAKIPEVKDDQRFKWWETLRDVPCSWVTSNGETERFLYYDGPSKLPAPFKVSIGENKLDISLSPPSELIKQLSENARKSLDIVNESERLKEEFGEEVENELEEVLEEIERQKNSKPRITQPIQMSNEARRLSGLESSLKVQKEEYKKLQDSVSRIKHPHEIFASRDESEINDGLYIEKTDNQLKILLVPKLRAQQYDLTNLKTLSLNEAQETLTNLIVSNGLTPEETKGLMDSWNSEFFERNGTRLISIMSTAQYNNYCTLKVSPQPTSLSRVGIILSPISKVEVVTGELKVGSVYNSDSGLAPSLTSSR